MDNKLVHFAIHANDTERAALFYSKIFNWKFNSYGDSDFMQIKLKGEEAPIGAIQHTKYSSINDPVKGFECSIVVENVEEVANIVEKEGGKVVMPKTEIPHVGWIIKFIDTEGNLVCAMEYAG